MSVAAEAEFGYVFKAQQQVLTPDHPDLRMSDADLGPTSATAPRTPDNADYDCLAAGGTEPGS
jgi:hypothetical protein